METEGKIEIERKIEIVVVRRGGDYMAHIKGDKTRWGAGESVNSAIGEMIRTHQKYLGISVELPRTSEQEMAANPAWVRCRCDACNSFGNPQDAGLHCENERCNGTYQPQALSGAK